MDEYSLNPAGDELDAEAPETPEDVAVLYTWANVHGGKYRDFSASRREFRAQQRHRLVEKQRQAELDAAHAREEAAAQEMARVQHLEEQARHDEHLRAEAEEARRRAEENIEQERQAAQHHVQAAEELKRALEEAQREMEEARHRAEEQAARYAEADARYRASARGQVIPGEMEDPYYYAGPLEPTAYAPGRGVRSSVPQRVSSERRIAETYYRSKGTSESGSRGDDSSGGHTAAASGSAGISSGDREAYRDLPPASQVRRDRPQPVAAVRPETPEDTRERHRADEQERLSAPVDSGNDEREDDGYYDHAPVSHRRSSDPTALNSAPSNAYLAPRVQQAPPPPQRPRQESSSRSDVRRSEEHPSHEEATSRRASSGDPVPGSPHMLDQIRARRRESAADMQARTTRRPRESGAMPVARGSHDDVRAARPPQTRDYPLAGEPVRPAPPRYGDDPAARSSATQAETPHRRLQQPDTSRGARPESLASPEWLVSEASSSPRGEAGDPSHQVAPRPEPREDRAEVRREERRARPRDTHKIPAEDDGFTLPPLPDRSDESYRRDVPMTLGQISYREESLPPSAASHRDDRPARPEPPPIVLTTDPDPLPARPSAERRRSDRSSGGRLTRELRASMTDAPAAEPEQHPRRVPEQEASVGVRPTVSGLRPADTLQQSRERVAARWYALKGLMRNSGEAPVDAAGARNAQREMPLPILAVVSLSGGVGKTSLVATVGRALSSVGERVLLADTTPHGLLPYYFGARELRPDVVRTFSPPPGSRDATVFMVNYEADRLNGDEAGQAALIEEMGRHVKGAQRLLLDLNGTSAWIARRLAGMNSTILVPIGADMNSVLGIKSVERFFAGLQGADGHPQLPYYVLNQFDASLPLHLDVREVLRQQLGDRLLPVMIRRSPSVAEALAEGMTVMDYAPESPVTEDYLQLAEWVRRRSAPAQAALRSTRWSER